MPYVEIDITAAGDPTRQPLIQTMIETEAFLHGAISTSGAIAGADGSFECDGDRDGYPDEWTYASGTNGVGAIVTNDTAHGGRAFKFTRSTGVGNSGGTLESADFFEVTPNRRITAQWQMKVTVAGVRVKVDIKWYTRAQVLISTSNLYDDSATNPTTWTHKSGSANPPATAYYAKLLITGGDTAPNVANCDIFFDDV